MPIHVKGVKRTYTHFTHNFLNIQLIFNPQKVLESWDFGLSNHTIKCYLCQRCQRLFRPSTPQTCFTIDRIWWLKSPKSQLSKTFCRLKIEWILRKLWVKMCVCSFNTFDMHSPQLFWATFNTSDIDSIWWYGWKALSLSFPKLFVDWKSVEY